jgi:hypothetical protein
LNHKEHKEVFDRAAEGGTRSGEAATTSRRRIKWWLVIAVSPDRAIGLHSRPAGRTQLFVIFVNFLVESVGRVCDAPYAPNAR